MFSVDDNFDFDDDEFDKVACSIDISSLEHEPLPKRRSFELGCTPKAESCQISTTETFNKHLVNPQLVKNVGQQTVHPATKMPLVIEKHQHNTSRYGPLRTALTELNPASTSLCNNSEGKTSSIGCPSTLKSASCSSQDNQKMVTFSHLDFDFDLDLDDATSWGPSMTDNLRQAVLPESNVHQSVCHSRNTSSANLPAGRDNGTSITSMKQRLMPDTSSSLAKVTSNSNDSVSSTLGSKRTTSTAISAGLTMSTKPQPVAALRRAYCNTITSSPPPIITNTTQQDYSLHKSGNPLINANRDSPLRILPAEKGTPSAVSALSGCKKTLQPCSQLEAGRAKGSPVNINISNASIADRRECISVGANTPSVIGSTRSTISASTKRKRKFPGPAGLLPRLKPGINLDALKPTFPVAETITAPQKPASQGDADVPCSQGGEEVFSDGPWSAMIKELEPDAQLLLDEYSLSAVIRKARLKQLPRGKVPVAVGLIDELSVYAADASAVLRDRLGGYIKGTIHRQLLKEYGPALCCGAVLVMRQVGVFSPSARNHYLNITPSNLVRIYCRNAGEVICHRLTNFTQDDFLPQAVIMKSCPELQLVAPNVQQSVGHGGGLYSIIGHNTSSPKTPLRVTSTPYTKGSSIGHPSSSTPLCTSSFTSTPTFVRTTVTSTIATPSSNAVVKLVGINARAMPQQPHGSRVITPETSIHSTPRVAQDLWEDDQLDELLTGLEEEMVGDF